jgi:hypothetical protein
MKYKLTQALRDYLLAKGWIKAADASEADVRSVVDAKIEDGSLPLSKVADLVDGGGIRNIVKDAVNDAINPTPTGPDPKKVFGGGVSGGIVRKASERYGTSKATGHHVRSKQPVLNPLTNRKPSISAGANGPLLVHGGNTWGGRREFKPCGRNTIRIYSMKVIHTGSFVGEVNGVWHEDFSGGDKVKAVLDDSVSGGINLVPVVVDSDIVTQLLLGSEIFPFVDVKDMPTGRRIEVPTMGAVSVTWGTPEGTMLPLWDTTGLLGTIPATVNTVAAAVEVGRDLLMNSAIEVGQALETSRLGSPSLRNLIASSCWAMGPSNRSGSSTPQGSPRSPAPQAPPDRSHWGTWKGSCSACRSSTGRPIWGPAIGQRHPVSAIQGHPCRHHLQHARAGEDYMAYTALGWPFRINNSIPSNKAAFVALKKYRLWRRKGFEPRWVTEGKELALKNLNLLIVRGLYAGRLLDASAAVISTDLQT